MTDTGPARGERASGFGAILGDRGFMALLVAQALGVFNDNAFKTLVAFAALATAASATESSRVVAISGALFVIPYLLFSSYAGHAADRYSKRTVIVLLKGLEVAIMGLGVAAAAAGHLGGLLVVLFLLGAHSCFLSPAKLGILPEMLRDEDLSRANGLLELSTYGCIILGTVSGGLLFGVFRGRPAIPAAMLVGVAAVGLLASLGVTRVPASGAARAFRWNFLAESWASLGEMRRNRALFLSGLGIAYFWFVGSIFLLNVLVYGRVLMQLGDRDLAFLNASISVGVGIGGLLAGKLSGDRVELGLVPIGSIGMGVFAVDLFAAHGSYGHVILGHLLLGLAGGLFIVPLSAYVQQQSEQTAKGRTIAAVNVMIFLGVLLGSGVTGSASGILGLGPDDLLLAVGIGTFAATAYILTVLPDAAVRLVLWLLTHTFYRISVRGGDYVPKRGPALLVGNHVSFADPFLVGACTQRIVRFLMYRPLYEARLIRPFAKLMGAIPVAETDKPSQIAASLRTARAGLEAGELVCIFAEGGITRTGNLLRFRKGFETIMKDVAAPIIPFYLDRVWGSIFSYAGGKFFFKWPKRVPFPVTVCFGPPLPPTTKAFEVRQAVTHLSAEAFALRKAMQRPLPEVFLRTARRAWGRFCMADSSGRQLSFGPALVGALMFRRDVVRRCATEEMVGLMLPPSVPAAVLNVALAMAGKVPVNLNYTASTEALDAAIDRCGLKTIYASAKFLEKAELSRRDGMVFVEDLAPEMTAAVKVRVYLMARLLPGPLLRRWALAREGNMDALATVIFSSGSTGIPKGVMLSHGNIVSNIEAMQQIFHTEPDDRLLGILPFFHSFGFTGALWLPLVSGFGVVYHHNPLDARTVGHLAEKHRVSVMIGTPTFYLSYIRRCTKEQFAHLRLAVVGAEKLKAEVTEAFQEKFGVELMEGYGCTELSPVVSVGVPDVRGRGERQVGHKPGTIGQPVPGVSVRIVDPDTFADRPVGEEGLLLVKGPNVMLGYLKDPEKTGQVIRDGWYVTGDIGRIDLDGFLTITDRLSRFSKIAGEMVPHVKVEEAIQQALGTIDLRCVVTSVPDAQKGERLVVLYTDLGVEVEEILGRLREMGLPNLWIPRKESFFRVDAIPMLGTGKLDLRRARELAAAATQGA